MRRVALDEKYSVTDDGLVWSGALPLEAIGGWGVNLHGKRMKVAYLVARAFVPNAEGRMYVRHKDGDRTNNAAENLEWCDEKECGKRGRRPDVRWIRAWHAGGDPAGCWRTVSEASAETGALPWQIRACLAGKRKMAGGLYWKDM